MLENNLDRYHNEKLNEYSIVIISLGLPNAEGEVLKWSTDQFGKIFKVPCIL